MPRVLTVCPRTDEPVSTRLRMRQAELTALTETRFFRCTGCGEVHEWGGSTAWLERAPIDRSHRA